MTKYILHGGFTRHENESNRSFYEELVRDLPDGGTVLLCYFASRDDDHGDEMFKEQQKTIIEQAHGKSLVFVMAKKESFLDQLKSAGVIYLHGGSTSKLLDALCTYPDLKPLMEGKTVVGSSAGAYVIAKYGASHSESKMREGLGLLPIRVVCHYDSPDLPPDPTSVELLRQTAPELELVILHDYEWKVFLT